MNNISYSKFINGLSKAGVAINRKMLSEMAIENPAGFAALVAVANQALEGKVAKEVKKETKKVEVKEETTDLSKMTVAELRALAKEKNITGASTMKKAELLDALK